MAKRNTLPRSANEIRWIPASELEVVHVEAQRPLNEKHVSTIIENFDPDAFGVVVVAEKNGTGTHHIIDGQHRVTALKRMGWADQTVPCLVKPTHDIVSEARMFDRLNTKRDPQAIDRFRVRVTAGYPVESAIAAIIEKHGMTLGLDPSPKHFAAVAAALQITNRHGLDCFDDALGTLRAVWPDDRNALHGSLVQGVAIVLARGANVERLRGVLAKASGPLTLIGYAKSARDVHRGTVPQNVARVICQRYNVGLRNGKLPEAQ